MYQKYMPKDLQNVTFKAVSKTPNTQKGQPMQPLGAPIVVPSVVTPQTTPAAPVNTNGLGNGNGNGAVAAPISTPATPSPSANAEPESNNGSNGASLNQPDAVSNTEKSLASYLAKPRPAPTRRKVADDSLFDIDVLDDSISVMQRVVVMSKRLGMEAPRVMVEQIPDTRDFWRGWAIFPIEAGPVPENVGRVENSFMKANTKERVGEQVLEFLLQLEQIRNAEYENMLAED